MRELLGHRGKAYRRPLRHHVLHPVLRADQWHLFPLSFTNASDSRAVMPYPRPVPVETTARLLHVQGVKHLMLGAPALAIVTLVEACFPVQRCDRSQG